MFLLNYSVRAKATSKAGGGPLSSEAPPPLAWGEESCHLQWCPTLLEQNTRTTKRTAEETRERLLQACLKHGMHNTSDLRKKRTTHKRQTETNQLKKFSLRCISFCWKHFLKAYSLPYSLLKEILCYGHSWKIYCRVAFVKSLS